MSADLMLTCKKRGEFCDGDTEKCIIVDETSMGSPHTEFGMMIKAQAGFNMAEIDDKLIARIKHYYEVLEHKDYVKINEVIKWLEEHKGEELEWEQW